MIISTSSSAKFLLVTLAPAALLIAAGCDRAASTPVYATAQTEPKSEPRPTPPAKTVPAASPEALYTADLTRAIAGEKKLPFPAGVAGIGGMICTPETMSGTSPATRAFTLTLPEDAAARRHVLAVVTPERGLLEIYTPYDDDSAETGDLIIPSDVIAWSNARTQNRFAINTDDLDGLRRERTMPEVLFLEPGRYRFALVNGIDAALLKSNGTAVKVTAACSVDWAPQEAGAQAARR